MAQPSQFDVHPGPVDWSGLKEELVRLPKETLAELINVWIKTFWTTQNHWMVLTEERHGFEEAARMDERIWARVGPVQAYRVKETLGLGEDVRSLAVMLKLTAPQWPPAGFDWEIDSIDADRLTLTVRQCPMGSYRKKKNLPLLPCKQVAPPLYIGMARVINERFHVDCLHAHPDPPVEGVMCRWAFGLSPPEPETGAGAKGIGSEQAE